RSKRDWSSDVCSSDLCSIVAVNVASPGAVDGSRAAPASTSSCTSTTGTLCISTTASVRPLGSVVVWTAGSLSAGGGGSAGGLVRSEERRVGKEWRWGG